MSILHTSQHICVQTRRHAHTCAYILALSSTPTPTAWPLFLLCRNKHPLPNTLSPRPKEPKPQAPQAQPSSTFSWALALPALGGGCSSEAPRGRHWGGELPESPTLRGERWV